MFNCRSLKLLKCEYLLVLIFYDRKLIILIFLYFITVNCILLGFGLLVKQLI